MSEKGEGELSRRSLLKAAGILGLGGAAALGISHLEESRQNRLDIFNAESSADFFGREGEFYLARFKGEAKVEDGSTIHDRPTYYYEREPNFPFTTSPDPRTNISIVGREQSFVAKDPLLVLMPAQEGDSGQNVKEITYQSQEGDNVARVYTPASWIIFTTDMVSNMDDDIRRDIESRSQYEIDGKKVACVNFGNTLFRVGESDNFLREFPTDAISTLQSLNFNSPNS
jgi:hypothetical protein